MQKGATPLVRPSLRNGVKVFAAAILFLALIGFIKDTIDAPRRERDRARQAAAAAEKAKERREEIIAAHKITAGMTRDEVLQSWGAPDHKNISAGVGSRTEQWVYHDSQYLYFVDGILLRWSTRE